MPFHFPSVTLGDFLTQLRAALCWWRAAQGMGGLQGSLLPPFPTNTCHFPRPGSDTLSHTLKISISFTFHTWLATISEQLRPPGTPGGEGDGANRALVQAGHTAGGIQGCPLAGFEKKSRIKCRRKPPGQLLTPRQPLAEHFRLD